MYPEDEPDYECPYDVGDEVFVTGTVSTTNTVGGTTLIKHEGLHVQIEQAWWDYEVGWRFRGSALEDADVESIRRQATSDYDAEHYRRTYPNNPALAEQAEQAAAIFDPRRTHFTEHDVSPNIVPRPR